MRFVVALLALSTVLLTPGLAPGGRSASQGRAWTRVGLGAVTQPAPVGNRFVLYAEHAKQLRVVALNARDGSTAWTAAASPSFVTAGEPAALTVREGTVFYLGNASAYVGAAQLVARDVATGDVVWQTAIGDFSTWPEICPDQNDAICVTGLLPNLGSGELRFDADTGRPLAPVAIGTATGWGRELGTDLFDPGTRNPELLVAVDAGKVAWRRPLSAIFTLARASSDGGWNFNRLRDRHLFIGSVGTTPVIKAGIATNNLAGAMTAGFETTDGHVVWRAPGWYACDQMHCPGLTQAGYSSPGSASEPAVGLRTVMTGIASMSMTGRAVPHLSADASVTVEGFTPATGHTIWAFKAGRNLGLMGNTLLPPSVDQNTIALREGGRFVALDLRTGSHHTTPATTRAWCERTMSYHLSNSSYYEGKSGEYVGQRALFACTVDGRRRATPSALPALVGQIGATTDGTTAWTDTTTVHGAPSNN